MFLSQKLQARKHYESNVALLVDIFGGHAVDDHLNSFVMQLQEKRMECLGDYLGAPKALCGAVFPLA